jgi:ASC-1-like (ASCH) protein
MRLHLAPFERIQSGVQKIEARLNDEKRKGINLGDEIEFSLRDNPDRKFKARVVELLKFPSFMELYSSRPLEEFGSRNIEHLVSSTYKYYSKEEEQRYGVLGIKFEILKW